MHHEISRGNFCRNLGGVHKCIKYLHCIEFSCYDCCHQMSDFKAKMYQIRFRLGLHPRPAAGAYSAPQTPSWI